MDLYSGRWHGKPLVGNEFVLSADEKTRIQARRRVHPRRVARDRRGQRVEHEYERKGAWAYMAAWDVHRARLFGRVEQSTGIERFDRWSTKSCVANRIGLRSVCSGSGTVDLRTIVRLSRTTSRPVP